MANQLRFQVAILRLVDLAFYGLAGNASHLLQPRTREPPRRNLAAQAE